MLNQQSEAAIRVRPLLQRLKAAVPLLPLPVAEEVTGFQFILVDRATMARVHGDFLGDPTETDVITFPYGEILVCPAVARDRAAEFGHKLEQEVLLYCLHGMLHLAGFDDTKPALAKEMAAAQEKLLRQIS